MNTNIILRQCIYAVFLLLGNTVIYAQARLSANFQQYLSSSTQSSQVVYFKQDGIVYLSTLMKVKPGFKELELTRLGAKIGTRAGDIYTVQIPENKLPYVVQLKGIDYIQLDEPVTPNMDIARRSSRVDSVHAGINLPLAYSGKNVVVGIIDAGFDYSHPTFYDTTGTRLRIKRVWEQRNAGTPPAGYNYGNELTDTSAMIAKGYEVSSFSHGTHVGGIAAGSGLGGNGNKYRGVAYESDLVFVGIRPEKTEWKTMGMASIIDGIQYIFDYAYSVGKPAVVNLSWGCSIGPNDGSSLFSQALNNMVGPGKIFVLSAGNNGDEKIHLLKHFTPTDTSVSTYVTFPVINGEKRNWIDLWGDAGQNYCVNLSLYNADTISYQLAGICTNNHTLDTFLIGTDGDTCRILLTAIANDYNGKPHILFDLWSKTNDELNIQITATTGKVHMWQGFVHDYTGHYGSFDKLGKAWAVDGDSEYTLGEMASTQSAITVAAYASKISFRNLSGVNQTYSGYAVANQIVPFSSYGPAVSNWMKPDIAAPGMTLASAVNSYDVSYAPGGGNYGNSVGVFTQNGRNYYYAEASGTSMSSPMVSGIVALMLEVNPGLTPEQIRKIIAETAIKDNFTTATPNPNRWGAGKINAYAAVQQAKLYLGMNETVSGLPESFGVFPNPTQGSFNLELESLRSTAIQVTVTNILGQKVFTRKWNLIPGQNRQQITLDEAPGLYTITLSGEEGGLMTQKIILH